MNSATYNRCSIMVKVALFAVPLLALFCVYIIGVAGSSTNSAEPVEAIRRVIVDVDAGPDDAWALFHLLSDPSVRVEAISCVKGNANVTNVARNVLRVLTALGKQSEIPVYLGSNEPLITPEPPSSANGGFFGSDGFSDIEFPDLPDPDMTLLRTSTLNDLNNLIEQYANEITIIQLGPLTNLALLFNVFPETRHRIREVFIMGGNRHGVGNTEKAAEFNFYSDPEAAHIVINKYEGNITVLPWETASRENLVANQTWRFEVLGSASHPVIQILNPVEKKPLGENDNWMPCDLLVAMAFTHPELVTEAKRYRADVELHGWLTRGQLVLDHMNEGQGDMVIIDNMDNERIVQMLVGLANSNTS
ncbi:pyrimidine-specific ribonucleoside hydrolase RihA-like isoform X2 [Armigeres subalbatus]|uniref:pyrimidine-specific ribonucleoside hydrolase RihA-like isoform X2 n=1 Tax=Armigeres subalbatus TaxID=124917 RepID=UPI002ED1C606